MSSLVNRVAESFSSTWRLLSDTTNFLSRVKLLTGDERDLKEKRDQLYRFRRDPAVQRQVRERIVEIRRSLRARGYDLRLGSKDIALEGFRHDDAMGEGFRRLVIGVTPDDIVSLAGDLNHQELTNAMQRRPGNGRGPRSNSRSSRCTSRRTRSSCRKSSVTCRPPPSTLVARRGPAGFLQLKAAK
jgi:hypothetical protein